MGHRKRKCTSLFSGHFTCSDLHFYLSLKRSSLSIYGPSKLPWGKDYFWFDTASLCRVPPCCTCCTSDPHSPHTWTLQKKKLCHVQATKGGMNPHMQLFSCCCHALIQNNNNIWKLCLVHSSANPGHPPCIMDILLPKSEHCRES